MAARGILTLYDILFSCRCSSVAEQRFCKPPAVGSSPTIGSFLKAYPFLSVAFVLRRSCMAVGTQRITLRNLRFQSFQ
jgi:hypothetical protein